jgi:hypothetical protein
MRRIVSLALYVAGGLLCVLGLLIALSFDSVDDTIEHSRVIAHVFHSGDAFVEETRTKFGRLPSPAEFAEWADAQPDTQSARHLVLIASKFPAEAVEALGPPPSESYVLEYWRGDWSEYFAGWSKQTTLSFKRSTYFILGSPIADLLAFTGNGLALILLGRHTARTGA